jgi:hypothetical protein
MGCRARLGTNVPVLARRAKEKNGSSRTARRVRAGPRGVVPRSTEDRRTTPRWGPGRDRMALDARNFLSKGTSREQSEPTRVPRAQRGAGRSGGHLQNDHQHPAAEQERTLALLARCPARVRGHGRNTPKQGDPGTAWSRSPGQTLRQPAPGPQTELPDRRRRRRDRNLTAGLGSTAEPYSRRPQRWVPSPDTLESTL